MSNVKVGDTVWTIKLNEVIENTVGAEVTTPDGRKKYSLISKDGRNAGIVDESSVYADRLKASNGVFKSMGELV